MSESVDDLEQLMAWVGVIDDSSYYEILGLLELADPQAVQLAFHEFALAFHPDVHTDASEEERDVVHYVFRRGAEAYRVLSDPALRAKYDLALAQGHLRLVRGEPARRLDSSDGLQSLEDLCRTPAARLSARNADALIGHGKLAEARRLLNEALSQDGYDNAKLEERIEALDLALFAMGG